MGINGLSQSFFRTKLPTILMLVIITLLAWLANRYHWQMDWTINGRHHLSPTTLELLQRLEGPLKVTGFTKDLATLHRPIQEFVNRYRNYKEDIVLAFVNPELEPERARALAIHSDGEVIIDYQGRSESLTSLTEVAMANALQRIARSGEGLVVYLSGHGERDPRGSTEADLTIYNQTLENKGLRITTVNLANTKRLPDNTAVLVIASPRTDLLPGEVVLIQNYLNQGGHLLWLVEPGSLHGLTGLADELGLEIIPGTVVDPEAVGLFGAAFALGVNYPKHPLVDNFNLITLLPESAAIRIKSSSTHWQGMSFIESSPDSALKPSVSNNSADFTSHGPLSLGGAFTRPMPQQETLPSIKNVSTELTSAISQQRVVVMGDGDFLSNSYLGNGGNLELGLNIINWLNHDDKLMSLPPYMAPDARLDLSNEGLLLLSGIFLVLLPLSFAAMGGKVWWQRRHH